MSDLQSPYPPAVPYAIQNSIAGPVKVIAIIHIVLGTLGVLGALILFAMGVFTRHHTVTDGSGESLGGGLLFAFVGVFVLLLGVFQLIVGYGLMTFKGWARILAIILSVFNLLSFPLGTALGGFTLYFLLKAGSAEEYQRLALTRSSL